MGGQRCIVFGCKSGHKRGVSKKDIEKKEKLHFFQVPKIDTELWQRALIRKDIVIKPGHSVCEKHFPEDVLVWRRELRAPDGTILGVSADYKTPKLKKGSLPSLYLGITPDGKPAETSSSRTKKSHSKAEKINISTEDNKNIEHNKVKLESPEESYSKAEIMNISTGDNENIEQNEVKFESPTSVEYTLEIPHDNEEIPMFEIIFNNEKSVALPYGWCRQNMRYANKRLVHFCQFVPRMENEILQPTCTKQVLVDENLEMDILIMRHQIEKKCSEEKNESFASLEELEYLLKIVDSWKLCSGITVSSNEEIQASFVQKDKEGILRSIQCTLCMPSISRSGCCDECRRSKKTISRKVARMKSEIGSHGLRKSLNIQQRRKLDELRTEMKNLRRGRERALARIKVLKELRIRDRQAYKASQKTFEQYLNESNLEGHQKLVVWEILNASKQADSRSRRYSRVWISFCLMLHRKSPVTYRFLRQTEVLPLPAPRTVLRFAQQNPTVNQNISQLKVNTDVITDVTSEEVILQDEIVPEEEVPNVEMETEVP